MSGQEEALLLGNSQYLGVNPAEFKGKLLNRSLAGSDYAIQLALLESLAPDMPHLRVLLLGFDNLPLHVAGIKSRKGDYADLFAAGMKWYHLPDISPFDKVKAGLSYSKLLKRGLVGPKFDFSWFNSIFSLSKAEAATIEASAKGADPTKVHAGFSVAPADGKKKMDYYVSTSLVDSNFFENVRAFKDIYTYCKEHKIELILLRSPTSQAFLSARPKAWNNELAQVLQSLRVEPGQLMVQIWDNDDGSFDIGSFDDPNHLNPPGFSAYSHLLGLKFEQSLAPGEDASH